MITPVRHAESAANVGHRTSDPATIPLTRLGLRQAAALAQAWAAIPSRIFSSPFQRAIDTAKPLATRFGLPIFIAPVQEFTYLSPDRCRETTAQQRRKWVEAFWSKSQPDFRDGTDAETFREFAERIRHSFRWLIADYCPGDVVVCHGQVIQMACWLAERKASLIDSNAMRDFRALDIAFPVGHCEQRLLRSI